VNTTILRLGRAAAAAVSASTATDLWKQASAPNGNGFLWARTTPTLKLWAYGKKDGRCGTRMVLHVRGKDADLFIRSLNFLDHFKNHVLEVEREDGECEYIEISDEEYDRQMNRPDAYWCEPGTGNRAWYDDEKSEEARATRDRYEAMFVNAWACGGEHHLAMIRALEHFERPARTLWNLDSLDSAQL
jgi:hypothetical protein